MPPEALSSTASVPQALPRAWRGPLAKLAAAWAFLILLTRADWADMAHQWWDISTYNHILLVPLILVWLVRLRWSEVLRLSPQAWWPGVGLVALALAAWFTGRSVELNLMSQMAAVMLLQTAVATVLGVRVAAALLFPLAYMLFLVPFGDEIVPQLQAITAALAITLTHASGIPASIDGIFIDTPAGLFEVAEACSGVKFLVAMIALGTLVANLCFRSPRRRLTWLVAAAVVPVLANGVRAWGTIFIAQSHGIEFAAGFDHIVYGWVFFALVMGGMLLVAWRFFDRHADDLLVDISAIERSPFLARLERFSPGFSQPQLR